VLGGSQTSFYFLYNILAGQMEDGSTKKILFPIVPEYIGYADQGIEKNQFVGMKPKITHIDEHTYKYSIDFDNLKITDDIAAIAISRPTNPTGNVISDEEVNKLAALAQQHNIPFILDNAYGLPFPNIVFTKATPIYKKGMIYVMSLSKIGLPSTRTSIVIADKEVIEALSGVNAIVSLSTGTVGQHLMSEVIKSGEVLQLANTVIQPFYLKKSQHAVKVLSENLKADIPWHLHKSEGALFLWLWCENMPITSMELYERLKERGVIVVPGEYFFPGFDEEWQHKKECIRISYSMKDEVVAKGLIIIAEEVNKAYEG
jgi:valine--pyruvate aminotransferase